MDPADDKRASLKQPLTPKYANACDRCGTELRRSTDTIFCAQCNIDEPNYVELFTHGAHEPNYAGRTAYDRRSMRQMFVEFEICGDRDSADESHSPRKLTIGIRGFNVTSINVTDSPPQNATSQKRSREDDADAAPTGAIGNRAAGSPSKVQRSSSNLVE